MAGRGDRQGRLSERVGGAFRSSAADLQNGLAAKATLADYGLKLVHRTGYLSLESSSLVLSSSQTHAAFKAAAECGHRSAGNSVYLATNIRDLNSKSNSAYSVVAAAWPLSSSGNVIDDEGIALNSWAAQDLKARAGDRLELTYLIPRPDGTYDKGSMSLFLRGIVETGGREDDRGLTPDFEGHFRCQADR